MRDERSCEGHRAVMVHASSAPSCGACLKSRMTLNILDNTSSRMAKLYLDKSIVQ